MGVPRAAPGRARPATTAPPAHSRSGGIGGDRGPADGHLSAGYARRMAPYRAHVGEAVPSRLRPAVAVSRRRPGEVFRDTRMTEVLRVMEPGLFTTIQDLGRPHAIASGVTPGGAMDRFAHSAANLLVGNNPGAATLECTVLGPDLVAAHPCVVAITGGDLDPRVDGTQVQMWSAIPLA